MLALDAMAQLTASRLRSMDSLQSQAAPQKARRLYLNLRGGETAARHDDSETDAASEMVRCRSQRQPCTSPSFSSAYCSQ